MNTQDNTIYFDTFVWNRHLHILTFRYASQFKGKGHLFLNVLFLCFSNIVLDVLKSFRLTQKPSKSKKKIHQQWLQHIKKLHGLHTTLSEWAKSWRRSNLTSFTNFHLQHLVDDSLNDLVSFVFYEKGAVTAMHFLNAQQPLLMEFIITCW